MPAVLHGEMPGLLKRPVHHRPLEQGMDGVHLGTRRFRECRKGLTPMAWPLPSPSVVRVQGTVGQRSYLVEEMFQTAVKLVLLVGGDSHVTGQFVP